MDTSDPSDFRSPPDGVLRVLQITDTHLYADPDGKLKGVCTDRSLRDVLALARQRHWPADLILLTGDLVHDETEAGYRRIAGYFDTLGVPVYTLPGNHEDTACMARWFSGERLSDQRHALFGHWQVILLDSHIPGSEKGHVEPAELQRMARLLDAHPEHHALICLHHHPVPTGSSWLDTMQVDNSQELLELAAAHSQVRGLLFGHIHQCLDQRVGSLRMLGSPSTCVQFKPHSDVAEVDLSSPGYRWLLLHPDGRIQTGVERLAELPTGLDPQDPSY
jgi:Icc protein